MIQRSLEIKQLQRLYEEEKNSIALIYGGARSEKGQLIREFCGDKDVFYYHARHASEAKQKELFAEEIREEYGTTINDPSYSLCFAQLKSKSGGMLEEKARNSGQQFSN